MSAKSDEFIAVVSLLRRPRIINFDDVLRASENAFDVSFNTDRSHQVIPIPNKPMFAIILPQMKLGVINVDRPYFEDVGEAADRTRDFAAKQAIQQHKAWMSVDLLDDPAVEQGDAYFMASKLLAEFVDDDVLALIQSPGGRIASYDPCFLPLLRSGNILEVFKLGPLDKTVATSSKDAELAAATAKARKRWSEFVKAFENRRPLQGFGVKKRFVEGDQVEHMWVEVLRIEGHMIHGQLSNDPNKIASLKLGDPINLSDTEIEDWIYTDGKQTIGGFQIEILKNR